jgi:hypothetical protein
MARYSDANYRRRLEMRSAITPPLVKQTTNTESLRQLGNQKNSKLMSINKQSRATVH